MTQNDKKTQATSGAHKKDNEKQHKKVEHTSAAENAAPSTPYKPKKKQEAIQADSGEKTTDSSQKTGVTGGSSKNSKQTDSNKSRYKGRGTYPNGRPRNFYNPPHKVLRHLQQQQQLGGIQTSEQFYQTQSQIYQLKLKYKTQLCKHYLDSKDCPLEHFCQFAHGPEDLRQPNDPLPKQFGKTALGAVLSNYKTTPCKFWEETGDCKFGDSCSFYHGEKEKRKLTDPLPNCPEEVISLPQLADRNKHFSKRGGNYRGFNKYGTGAKKYQNGGVNGFYFNSADGATQFSSLGGGQQNTLIQITNWADIAAIGGFNNMAMPLPPQPEPAKNGANEFAITI